MACSLELNVRALRPTVRVLDLVGELAAACDATLLEQWTRLEGAEVVLLNFSRATVVDSSGMSGLVALIGRVREQKQKVALVGYDPKWFAILDLTRLTDDLPLYTTEQEALDALDAP